MTLSSAFNIINTSFQAIGPQSATIATNVANANTVNLTRAGGDRDSSSSGGN